jgi:hypothetical protein
MLDDIRNTIDDDLSEEEQLADIPIDFDEIEAQQAQAKAKPVRGFLGMTAGERAFLSIIVFSIVLIFGAAILAVTGRITL